MKNTFKLIFFSTIVLLSSCIKTPKASFKSDKTTVESGQSVKFTNTSIDDVTSNWDFGDGSTSTEISPSHTFIKVGTFNVTLNSYSKKKKKVDSYSSKITVNDIRDKFTGNYNEYGTFSIGGQPGDGNDFVIVSKSSSYEDRINFNYPSDALNNFYGIVSGNNIIIPSQSHNGSGYDNNNNFYTFTLPYSGNGNLNGNLITISLSGIYTESGSTGINSYSFSANLTWTKQ